LTDLKKEFEEHHFEVIYAIPVMHDGVQIAYNGDYGRQRWEKK
jgi:hypothetical protein